ncbi:MAG TPA: YCF48-related protein [Solimonas sp.]|nr:YCF48-related protein [Solimonas sp.]
MSMLTKKWLATLSLCAAAATGLALAQDEAAPEEVADPAAEAVVEDEAAAESEAPAAPAVPVKAMDSEIMPLTPKGLLLDVTNTGKRLIAVGDRGGIIASVNGQDWVQVKAPVRSVLTALSFADENNGWAVGHDATILATTDGGRTWKLQNFQPELEKPFLDVLFVDASKGFAVGAYGLFYQTIDGGQNWAEVSSPIREEELHFNGIARLANGDLFIAGEQGMLAVSADGGATWTKVTSPYESSLFGVQPFGEKGALIYGLRGNAYVTQDARGGEWTKLETNSVASIFGGLSLEDGGYALVGLNGVIFLVDGSGAVRSLQTPTGTPLSAAVAFGNGLLAVGESGVQRVSLQ